MIVILGKKLKTCRSENRQEDALFMCLGLGVVRREKNDEREKIMWKVRGIGEECKFYVGVPLEGD